MSDSPDDRAEDDHSSRAEATESAERAAADQSGDPADGDDAGARNTAESQEDEEWDDPPSFESSGSGMRGRDVEVPMRVYKAVTVFSTLIAVICVVGGFIILDRATNRAQLPLSEVDPLLALLGIGTILFGAASYAFATRFRAAGMGRSKNDDDESADNG